MEEPVRIDQCNSIRDFRLMARRRLPGPIFHYIDGAADDEVTHRRNTEAYERCDLVPNVLAGVESIDMSTTARRVRRYKAALSSGCEAHPAIRSRRKQPEQAWRRRNV